jgi:hypothetical protein
MRTIFSIVLVFSFNIGLGQSIFAPQIDNNIILKNISKRKKQVIIRTGWIGLTTKKDSVKYHGKQDLSYEIYQITKDSLILRAPKEFQYTVEPVVSYRGRVFTSEQALLLYGDKRFITRFKKDKRKYEVFMHVDKYLYRSFSIDDLVSIQYPPYGSEHSGCIMCIFLPIIPIANIFWFREVRKQWHPATYKLTDWQIEIEGIRQPTKAL